MSGVDRRCDTEVHEVRRLEVINGELGRRKWSAERKGEIVAESMQPGVFVSEVARRHNLTPQQLFAKVAQRGSGRRLPLGRRSKPANPSAEEALLRIQQLYRIEKDIRGRAADERRAVRQTRARPILDALHPWLQDQLERVPSGSKIASALRYPLNHWDGLLLCLDDGRIEILSTRSNVRSGLWPYREKTRSSRTSPAGQRAEDQDRGAILAALIETAKLSGINPEAWLADVLARLASGHRMRDIDDLLPWHWPSAESLAKAA